MDNNRDHSTPNVPVTAEDKPSDPAIIARNNENRAIDAPELYVEEPKYSVAHAWSTTAPETVTSDDKEVSSVQPPFYAKHRKRILGCASTHIALITLLAFLLIGAAIGGGVGGHLAARNKPTATITATVIARPNPTGTTATASNTPSNTTATATTTTPSSPFHFTLYASPSFVGAAQNVTAAANVTLPWRAHSYVWDQQGSGCCALFCREGRDVGYRCDEVTYQDDVSGGGVDGVA
ncbi:hypothetical protein UCDDS831_g08797 [Diplodia seriata]|uniref:Uncharacterized protein n=1 Tax=Diplodia seriata TaxID=420778 RepID=A0A0G2DTZ1_9PEZI|nr:hypothetical protein UCDDS831_g08797 [Diplodia seriata]